MSRDEMANDLPERIILDVRESAHSELINTPNVCDSVAWDLCVKFAEIGAKTTLAIMRDLKARSTLSVLAERHRQIAEEGWTSEHDDNHVLGELLNAAKSYFLHATGRALYVPNWPSWPESQKREGTPLEWSWERKWWKPKDQRRDLVRAGALALAEMERIKRNRNKYGRNGHLEAEALYALIISEIERIDRSSLTCEQRERKP